MSDNLLTTDVAPVTESDVSDMKGPDEETTKDGIKPENVPEKFWDATKKEIRVDALLSSYLALEKRLSKMVPIPETDDDKQRILKLLGVPGSAGEYQIELQGDILDIDPELNQRLHQKGFTNDQVQEVYNLANEKLVPFLLELAAEFQSDRELERLVNEFGGSEKWAVVSKQLQEYGQKNLPSAAYEGLACSYDGVMALYNMMKANIKNPLARDNGAASDIMDEKGLRDMMQNPKYWRDRNPAFIAKVSEGFQRLYGEK